MEELVLSKIDVEGAHSLSTCINNVKKLDVRDCNMTSLGIEALTEAIKSRTNSMEELDLSENDIDVEAARSLSTCINNIEVLNIRECNMTSHGIEALADAIKDRKNPMEKLDLSGNGIDIEGARFLLTCINNIKRLALSDCNMTSHEIEVLADAIKNRGKPMEELDLSENEIDIEAARSLSNCINNIDVLNVRDCYMTSLEIEALAEAIKDK